MKIIHERKKCIGCGVCVSLCEEIFQMSKDGKVHLKSPDVVYSPGEEEGTMIIQGDIACVKEAASACPVECIRVEE